MTRIGAGDQALPQVPDRPSRTDLKLPSCSMWQNDRGCLPTVDDGAHAVGSLSQHEVCVAVYALAGMLRCGCTMDRISRCWLVCQPSAVLEEMLRLMKEGCVRGPMGAEEDGSPKARVALNDLVRRAVCIQDPETRDLLGARLMALLAAILDDRRALPGSSDAASIF